MASVLSRRQADPTPAEIEAACASLRDTRDLRARQRCSPVAPQASPDDEAAQWLQDISEGTKSVGKASGRLVNPDMLSIAKRTGSLAFIANELPTMRKAYPNLSERVLVAMIRKQHRNRRSMSKRDICNVELVTADELIDAMGPIIESMGMARCLDELGARYELGPCDPDKCDVADVPPYKSAPSFVRESSPRTVKFRGIRARS